MHRIHNGTLWDTASLMPQFRSGRAGSQRVKSTAIAFERPIQARRRTGILWPVNRPSHSSRPTRGQVPVSVGSFGGPTVSSLPVNNLKWPRGLPLTSVPGGGLDAVGRMNTDSVSLDDSGTSTSQTYLTKHRRSGYGCADTSSTDSADRYPRWCSLEDASRSGSWSLWLFPSGCSGQP